MKTAFTKTLLAALLGCAALSACAPLIIGGAVVGGVFVATDRRTSGAQLEDEGIKTRAGNRVGDVLPDRGHVNITSYNRQVLLTGEVDNEADKKAVEQAVNQVPNVRLVVNELAIMPISSFVQRSNDTLISGRIKASFVDAKDLYANAFKIFTERKIVYLMGRVTQREADRATEIARNTPGVERVVRALEIISEEELQGMLPKPGSQPTPQKSEAQ
jgi:osmotically-inducible protein OsmY